jgi:hypothetical protein
MGPSMSQPTNKHDSMEHSPSSETKTSGYSRNTRIRYHIHKIPKMDCILSHISPHPHTLFKIKCIRPLRPVPKVAPSLAL